MPQNLFAACRVGGVLVPRRVRLSGPVQDEVAEVFAQQDQNFFDGVDTEVPFDGRWKPDANELLTLDVTDEAQIFLETLNRNATAVEVLGRANLGEAGIKALFTGDVANKGDRVLVQRFTATQVLSRGFALFLQGDTFSRLTTPSFALANALTFVIEGGMVKFKSFQNLKSILDIADVYREATNGELLSFGAHQSIQVPDLEEFALSADQATRKLINAIIASGVLDRYTPIQIQEAAEETRLEVVVNDGKIVMPSERRELKNLLQFLDESRYAGPLTRLPYVTNSRRPAQT